MLLILFFFFQAEDGIRDLVRSRGLGDVYKRQHRMLQQQLGAGVDRRGGLVEDQQGRVGEERPSDGHELLLTCLLYTSDAADERSSVDLGGRRIIKKKKRQETC